jgi:transposase
MSFIAAITQSEIIASQVIEGAFDSTLIEAFIYKMVHHLRTDPKTANKNIVLFMDNAAVHRHGYVKETCQRMKVTLLMNAEYSPWLNPVE